MSYSLGAGNLDVDTWSTITSGMSTEFFRNFDNVISEIERRYPFLKRRIVLTLGSQRNLSSLDNPFPVSADRATGNTHFLIGDSNGRLQVTPGISDQPFRVANRTAGAVAPTIAHVAPAGRRALLTGGTVFVACGATPQPAVAATLVDSADGEVWSGALAAAVNGPGSSTSRRGSSARLPGRSPARSPQPRWPTPSA